MLQSRWSDVGAITAAKQRLLDRMPGWRMPAAYGVTLVAGSDDSEVRFPVVNVPVHELPSLVLGLLTGRRHGSGSYELAPSELEAAIALLAPAEAAAMYNHPNLWSWRELARSWDVEPSARVYAVFVDALSSTDGDRLVQALRGQIARGDRNDSVFLGPS